MRLNNVQFISINRLLSFGQNEEIRNQKANQDKNEAITANIWGVKNKANIPFVPYFAGVDTLQPVLPPNYERSHNFKICNIDKLTCPSCGKPMLPRPLFEELKFDFEYVPETEFVNVLSYYVPYMRKVERNIFKEVKDLSEDYPNLTLKQLVLKLKDERLTELEAIQFKKLNSMKSIVHDLQKYERPEAMEVIMAAENKIKLRSADNSFTRKTFIGNIENLKIHNIRTKQRLIDIAESFPTSSEAECAWIVKYSGKVNVKKANGKKLKRKRERTSAEIAERFLIQSATNTDHMLAQDPKLGGKDIIPNYMAMHSGCNSDKTNKTFMEWYNENPEARKIYIRKYLQEVKTAIDNGEIDDPRYLNYPQEAAATIKKLSGGKLNFQILELHAS